VICSSLNWRTTFCIVRQHNLHILFMRFTLFYTANCLYIIFYFFLISLQLASTFNISVTQMLHLQVDPRWGFALNPGELPFASPLNLTYHFQKCSAAPVSFRFFSGNTRILFASSSCYSSVPAFTSVFVLSIMSVYQEMLLFQLRLLLQFFIIIKVVFCKI